MPTRSWSSRTERSCRRAGTRSCSRARGSIAGSTGCSSGRGRRAGPQKRDRRARPSLSVTRCWLVLLFDSFAVCREARKALDAEILRCSFCSKSQSDVRKLIAGPAVYICECVDVCQEIIAGTVIDKTEST
ncbi:MAG: hypothetical protein DMG10_12740 [Acidobacteria bacterium]|nr:MAG: hypothetical protein DMG10_12740 [Acidobacteriota bacterium]